MEKRVQNYLYRLANAYIGDFMVNLKDHPEIVAEIMRKPAELLANDLAKTLPRRMLPGVVGDAAAGGALGEILPIFGVSKKHAGLLQLGARFLGRKELAGSGAGNSTSSNAIDSS